jgi:small basic protein
VSLRAPALVLASVWLPLLGLVARVLLGLALRFKHPNEWARYTAVGILAALDSLLGAFRAELEGHFDTRIFLSGFYTNALLAAALTFLGDRLGIDLYLVALFAFGWRIFQNVAVIRRHFL